VTANVTVSHERAAELRSHMLDAADEFSTGAIAALRRVRNAAGDVMNDDEPLLDQAGSFRPELTAAFDRANDAIDDALSVRARVHLLFGDQSPAGIAATGATAQLRNMQMALEHRPNSIRDRETLVDTYDRSFERFLQQHERFNVAALVALEETWWDRFRQRRRRRKTA